MVGFVDTFDLYHHKFNFDHFFSSPVKLQRYMNLKFRPKANYGCTNHCYLHSAIVEVLYNFKVK